MGDCKLQPIWEVFYKTVIGHSITCKRQELPGWFLRKGGSFVVVNVNVRIVTNILV